MFAFYIISINFIVVAQTYYSNRELYICKKDNCSEIKYSFSLVYALILIIIILVGISQ